MFSNRLINILESFTVKCDTDRERINGRSIAMGKLFCTFDHIASRQVIVLQLPGFCTIHYRARYYVCRMILPLPVSPVAWLADPACCCLAASNCELLGKRGARLHVGSIVLSRLYGNYTVFTCRKYSTTGTCE